MRIDFNESTKKFIKFMKKNEYSIILVLMCAFCFVLGACTANTKEIAPVTIEPVTVKEQNNNDTQDKIEEVTIVESESIQAQGIETVVEESEVVEEEPKFFEEYDFSTYTKPEIEETVRELDSFVESARNLNIVDDGAIEEAEEIMESAEIAIENHEYVSNYTEDDLNLLAWIIYIEAGDNSCEDEEQQLVGQVIMNRLAMGGIGGRLTNPSIADVINERGQYYIAVQRGYDITPWNINMSNVTEKCFRNAKAVLEGEVDCPSNVVYQATFKQGSGVYKSFYHSYYNDTTYFCYL